MFGISNRLVATVGSFTGLALILHLLENLLPAWGPPGAKLGLANLAALLLLYSTGWLSAVIVTLLRIIVGSLMAGTFLGPGFLMSLAGGVGSVIAMGLLLFDGGNADFKLTGITGAITHNICQLAVAYFFLGTAVLYYLPGLLFFAVPCGIFTGTVAQRLRLHIMPNLCEGMRYGLKN